MMSAGRRRAEPSRAALLLSSPLRFASLLFALLLLSVPSLSPSSRVFSPFPLAPTVSESCVFHRSPPLPASSSLKTQLCFSHNGKSIRRGGTRNAPRSSTGSFKNLPSSRFPKPVSSPCTTRVPRIPVSLENRAISRFRSGLTTDQITDTRGYQRLTEKRGVRRG